MLLQGASVQVKKALAAGAHHGQEGQPDVVHQRDEQLQREKVVSRRVRQTQHPPPCQLECRDAYHHHVKLRALLFALQGCPFARPLGKGVLT